MIDVRHDDLHAMQPAIESGAAEIKAADADARTKLSEYQAKVLNASLKVNTVFSLLWDGQDKTTSQPLPDEQVIPTLQEYVDAAIERAQVHVQTPWNDEDLQESSGELALFTQIKENGLDGLFQLCQQTLDSIPRKKDTGEIDAHWMPLVQRWQHYQELIDAAK